MTDLLTLQNVSKSYNGHLALNNVSLNISSGKIIGLLGPNGSGKTTMIKLINGLLQPDSGSIQIASFPPSVESKNLVAYLPDTTYLNEDMAIEAILTYFQDFYADFDRRLAEKLLVDLNINLKEKVQNLSKGNKEKVQLILVMSRRAKLYILDEPIAGVDPAAREYILRTIISNYNPEASVIISTHLIADIEPILDEVFFLYQGNITLHGNADDLRQKYARSVDSIFREHFRL